MPKGIVGFQPGNIWRFQPGNKHGKGGKRQGAGRPPEYSHDDLRLIQQCPLCLSLEAFWYVRRWLCTPHSEIDLWTNERLRKHKIMLRIFRRIYGGKQWACIKRFYAKVKQNGYMR